MKNMKKMLFIVSCICAIICIIIIAVTYSRYRSSASGTAEVSIARWNIKVNNATIKNNSDLSNVITPIFTGTKDINPNIIAPTAEGYFDLSLDYTDTDVSFDYSITVNPNSNSSVQDLVATGYSFDGGTTIINLGSTPTITDAVLKSDNVRTKDIRIYIKWDDENGTMDNSADTAATIPENAKALLDVNVLFTQNANTGV